MRKWISSLLLAGILCSGLLVVIVTPATPTVSQSIIMSTNSNGEGS